MPLPLESYLTEFSDPEKPLVTSRLVNISNLTQEELALFEQTWAKVGAERRLQVVSQLVDLAEDNFELNFDEVFRSCLRDTDEAVRARAVEGLWENEDASLISPLIVLLRRDTAEAVRAEAAAALGKFALLAEHKKLHPSHTDKIGTALLEAIDDPGEVVKVRCQAIQAIAPLNLPQVKGIILQAYQSYALELKVSAIYAMGRNCDPSWLPFLLKELGSDRSELRLEAAKACGELEEEEAVPSLAELLWDSDAQVQRATIMALGQIGGSEAKAVLRQCLQSSETSISQAAEEALKEVEDGDEPFTLEIQ